MSISDVQQTASNPSSAQLEVTACPKLNGRLVKEGGPEVYLIDQGLRRHIPNFNLFKPSPEVTTACLETIEEGSPVSDNAVIITDGGPAYLVDVNPKKGSKTLVKRAISSAETFDQYQFNWDKIQRVPAIVVAALPDGDGVMPRS